MLVHNHSLIKTKFINMYAFLLILRCIWFSASGVERHLLHSICWAPVHLFSTAVMETAKICWEWLLAARPDLELQVSCMSRIELFLNIG